jgi:hypothetical protein
MRRDLILTVEEVVQRTAATKAAHYPPVECLRHIKEFARYAPTAAAFPAIRELLPHVTAPGLNELVALYIQPFADSPMNEMDYIHDCYPYIISRMGELGFGISDSIQHGWTVRTPSGTMIHGQYRPPDAFDSFDKLPARGEALAKIAVLAFLYHTVTDEGSERFVPPY